MRHLTFDELRAANIERLPLFRNAKGQLSHSKPDGSDWSPAQWLQAVTGELGEYANLRKKVERGDISMEDARPALADELADVMIYLDILAFQLNIDIGEAVRSKFNRVSDRVKCNVKL
jgi:NTP pyrophosphatase (non-canonical NTP hydrolase)